MDCLEITYIRQVPLRVSDQTLAKQFPIRGKPSFEVNQDNLYSIHFIDPPPFIDLLPTAYILLLFYTFV